MWRGGGISIPGDAQNLTGSDPDPGPQSELGTSLGRNREQNLQSSVLDCITINS